MAQHYPPGPSHHDPESDPELRAKVQSKIHVATFLAGFVFATLVEVLMSDDHSAALRLSALFLTASLGLFVACIYMYDQLNMPKRYWTHVDSAAPESRLDRLGIAIHRRAMHREQARLPHANLQYDRVYAHMVATWTIVFTPAVGLAVVGFVLLLFRSETILGLLGSAVLICTALYYWIIRPRLTVD